MTRCGTTNKKSIPRPALFTITGFLMLLCVATLILSLMYLSLHASATAASIDAHAQRSTMLFRRLESQFTRTLYDVNLISNAVSVFCSVSNKTFLQFLAGLREIDELARDNSGSKISFPYTIVWAKIVRSSELEHHTEQLKMEGFPNYDVYEYDRTTNDRIAPNTSDPFLPVLYNFPLDIGDNFTVRGFNLLSNSERAKLVTLANTTRRAVASSRLLLVDSKLPGFFVYSPVFANNTLQLAGVVIHTFLIESLARDLLDDLIDDEKVRFVWSDITDAQQTQTMFSLRDIAMADTSRRTRFVTTIFFAQRKWQFELTDLTLTESIPLFARNWLIVIVVFIFCMTVAITILVHKYCDANQKIRELLPIQRTNIGNRRSSKFDSDKPESPAVTESRQQLSVSDSVLSDTVDVRNDSNSLLEMLPSSETSVSSCPCQRKTDQHTRSTDDNDSMSNTEYTDNDDFQRQHSPRAPTTVNSAKHTTIVTSHRQHGTASAGLRFDMVHDAWHVCGDPGPAPFDPVDNYIARVNVKFRGNSV